MKKGDLVRVKHAILEAWDMGDHGYLWVVDRISDISATDPFYTCRSLATGRMARWFADEMEETSNECE